MIRPRTAAMVCALVLLLACGASRPGTDKSEKPNAHERHRTLEVSQQERDTLLARSRVWAQPPVPIERVNLSAMFTDLPYLPGGELPCNFVVGHVGGTTPKFDCELPGGEIIRVKYGNDPELHAEAAATRLLSALGFGADRVSLVKVVRCFGCPFSPHYTLRILDFFDAYDSYRRRVQYSDYRDFEWASVERRLDAPAVVAAGAKGWAWGELKKIDSARGGATPAEVDAFRLMALFLNHWDNKSENQRLVCLPPSANGRPCLHPFAMIQDTGASFGPRKLDLDGWRNSRIWSDANSCEVSMSQLPYAGATFAPSRISEDGRKFFAGLIGSLSEKQLRDLIESARFAEFDGGNREERIAEWVAAFRDRIRQIATHAPCP